MASRQFSFKERQAKLVADTIASTYIAGPLDLLKVDAPKGENYVTFRYQGGTMVRVFLFDVGTFQVNPLLHPAQEWVVYTAVVRWNNSDGRHEITMWPEDIRWVSGTKYIHTPRIVPLESISGSVNVYRRGSRWFVTEHPEEVVNPGFTLVKSVRYWPLIAGDLDRAWDEAYALIPASATPVSE